MRLESDVFVFLFFECKIGLYIHLKKSIAQFHYKDLPLSQKHRCNNSFLDVKLTLHNYNIDPL